MTSARILPSSAAALLCLSMLLPANAAGQTQADARSQLPTIERWTLPNGLQVAHAAVRDVPVVAVQVWYRAGSKDEPRNRRGLSRMFQHLMFQGSTHVRPGQHTAYVRRVGGDVAASAIEDAIALQNVVPAQYLDMVMKLEADRMRGLEWREEAVEQAREAALADLRRAMGDPLKRAVRPFLELAYPDHPYAWEAVGDAEDLAKVTLDELNAFHETYYVPNNALLVVVGDVDRATVEKAAARHFGGIAKGADPPRPADPRAAKSGSEAKRRELAAGPVGVVVRGFHIPEAEHDDIYALQVLSIILGTGQGAWLDQQLVDKKKLALQAGATAIVREHPGLFLTYAAYDDPGKGGEIEKSLFELLGSLATKPPSATELARARKAILADFVFRIEKSAGLASQTGMSWVLTGDPGQFISDIAELEAVTPKDVARVAKTYLTKGNSVTIVLPPQGR